MVSQYCGMHVDPFFEDHLVPFILQGPLEPLVAMFCLFFWDHLDPTSLLFHVSIFSVIFFAWSVLSFYFLYFLLHMLMQLPLGRLAVNFVRSLGSLPLILELITQLLIIVNRFASLRRGACIALGRFLFSQLLRSQFPCICIIYLKVH